ncbi:protein kinase [Pendulispora rubella]|uniref:Protein kinase n=1 Tax=Pendulispora rubella TaxID=2741070 RepID=A0ABZ2LNN9_9BACT
MGETVGSYRLIRLLGEGSAGVVYLGEHPLVGARVAIKILHEYCADSPDMLERFINEAKAANVIQSPHIVRCVDFGTLPDGGSHYAVMEYLEGQTLEQLLARRGVLEVRHAAEVCRQIAVGMAGAHAAGIIHRDLKPANAFVQFDTGGMPFVRILDFGIAKLTESSWRGGGVESLPLPKATLTGTVMGTPLYCSPEQADGKSVTTASDIYSLGAMAYELVTGRAPIEGDNLVQIFVRKSTVEPVPIQELCADLPPEFAELVMQMLARAPEGRPASMDDVAQRLEAILQKIPASLRTAPPVSPVNPSLNATLASAALPQLPLVATPRPSAVSSVPVVRPSRFRWGPWGLAAALTLGIAAFAMHGTYRADAPGSSAPSSSPSAIVRAPELAPSFVAAAIDTSEPAPAPAPIPVESLAVAPRPSARRPAAHKAPTPPPAASESARPVVVAPPVNSAGKLVNPFD